MRCAFCGVPAVSIIEGWSVCKVHLEWFKEELLHKFRIKGFAADEDMMRLLIQT